MRHAKLIALVSILLTLLSAWGPVVKLLRYNLYLYQDTLWMLSGTLIIGLVFMKWMPNRIVPFITAGIDALPRSIYFQGASLLVVLLSLYLVNQNILHAFLNSGDEHSCYFLAQYIQSGKLWATPPPYHDEFFSVTHIGNKAGKWFSVYPPGWPLFLALGLAFNIPDWVNPLITVISLIFLYQIGKEVCGSRAAWFALLYMVTTVFFLMNGASYFSHSTCLLMVSIFFYAYLKWRKHRSLWWAALGAFTMGYGLGTRYLTMFAMAAPLLLYEMLALVKKKIRWGTDHTVFAGILAVLLGLNLYYNYLITGNYFEVPNHFHHSWERLGFRIDFTPLTAMRDLVARIFFLMGWSAPIFVPLYFFALRHLKDNPWAIRFIQLAFLYSPIAYLLYYSWGGNQFGPRYYVEGFPFLAFTVAGAARKWWTEGSSELKKFLIGIFFASLAFNFYQLAKHGGFWDTASSQRKALYQLSETSIDRPAIVFIRAPLGDRLILAQEDVVRNHPDLNTKIIYAHDRGDRNKILLELYPDRSAYLGSYDRAEKKARLVSL